MISANLQDLTFILVWITLLLQYGQGLNKKLYHFSQFAAFNVRSCVNYITTAIRTRDRQFSVLSFYGTNRVFVRELKYLLFVSSQALKYLILFKMTSFRTWCCVIRWADTDFRRIVVSSSSGQALNSGRGCLILKETELQSFETSAVTETVSLGEYLRTFRRFVVPFIFMVKQSSFVNF